MKEYDVDQLEKRANGHGGIWRIPPSFDGHVRAPVPRFTALDAKARQRLQHFFLEWTRLALRAMRPGAHLFMATNASLAPLLYAALGHEGLECRRQIIRLVRTLRGGDRPKNAEHEFPQITSTPRGCYEPWGLFRKPLLPKMRVSDYLREFQTGGLRRMADGKPLADVIASERTPKHEREIANHPSLKPQSFLRQMVYASLPLGEGVIVDPFSGSGSTLAAAEAIGVSSIGVERHRAYYEMAKQPIPQLTACHMPEVDALVGISDGPRGIFPLHEARLPLSS